MTASQTLLRFSSEDPVFEKCCLNCSNLTKKENQHYCSFFEAFVSDETLTVECDFLGVKK